jgi:hypothetical protein
LFRLDERAGFVPGSKVCCVPSDAGATHAILLVDFAIAKTPLINAPPLSSVTDQQMSLGGTLPCGARTWISRAKPTHFDNAGHAQARPFFVVSASDRTPAADHPSKITPQPSTARVAHSTANLGDRLAAPPRRRLGKAKLP